MKKYQYFILGLILAIGGTAMAAVFNSSQVGTNPVNNYYLQTNGSTSSWQPVSATGGSGTISTSTVPTIGQIPYWTSNGYPSLLGSTATTSVTCTGTVSCTGFNVLGSSPITINGASGTSASSTLLSDSNTFTGVDKFTNASSDFSGTWQTHAPAYFQTALGFTPYNATNPSSFIALTALSATYPIIDTSGVFSTALSSSTLTASSPLTGSFAQVGTGGTLGIQVANTSQGGYLTNTDWNTFNGKQYAFSTSTLTASSPLTGSFIQVGSGGSLGCTTASSGVAGCLSSTAFDTFNGKQNALGYTPLNQANYFSTTTQNTITTLPLLSLPLSQITGMFAYPFPSAATSTPLSFTGLLTISNATTSLASLGTTWFTGITGSTQCLHVDTNGKLTGTGSDCGAGGGGLTSVGLSSTNSTLTIGSSPLTSNGTLTADLNLAHGNTFTALQQFNGNASTTQLTVTGSTYLATTGGNVGIGTTSPQTKLHINSSSSSQVLLTGSDTDSGVAMRETGNHFYISTTSPTTYATTSPAALDLNMNAGTTASLGIATTSPMAIISAVGTGSTPLMAIASSTATGSGMPVYMIDQFGHQYVSGPTPTLSSCGTSPSVTGNDSAMIVTVGSVSATGCTITFANAYTTAPVVNITNQSMSITNAMTFTVSTSAITITQTALTSAILDIQVKGIQ